MKRKAPSKRSGTGYSRALARALRQPGVREAMAVYQAWRKLEQQAAPYQSAMSRRTIVSASDGTTLKCAR
jgi:hypothetical protein